MISTYEQVTIEDGYLILTMMPSLYCDLRCPHCYLSTEQRRDKTKLSLMDIQSVCNKIDEFYIKTNVDNKKIILYWYGGEPTSMGIEYFDAAINIINNTFTEKKGYTTKHIILSSLIDIDDHWFEFFKQKGDGYIQTSYDGRMRGKGYLRKWEKNVKKASQSGLKVGTLSVLNEEILSDGAIETYEYLQSLGVSEMGFLPFMLNEQNKGSQYNKYAPSMKNWSIFLSEISNHSLNIKESGSEPMEIGPLNFVHTQDSRASFKSNIAGQTLFLMPNGDLTLPDYRNGWEEFMRPFGNLIKDDFISILRGTERTNYLLKQVMKNDNKDCNNCLDSHRCVMEFWKDNKKDDDCFGGKLFLNWYDKNKHRISSSTDISLA